MIEIKGKGFTKEGLEFYCQFYHKDINDICFEKINLKYNIITKDNLIHVNKLNQVKKNYQKKIKRIQLEQGNKENNIEFICGLLKISPKTFEKYSNYYSEFTYLIEDDVDNLYSILRTFVQDSSDNYSENSYILIPLVIHNYTGSILYLSSRPRKQREVQYKVFFKKYKNSSINAIEKTQENYEDCGNDYKQALKKFKFMCNQLFVQNKKMLLNDISKWNEFKNADKIKNVKEIIDKNLNIEK